MCEHLIGGVHEPVLGESHLRGKLTNLAKAMAIVGTLLVGATLDEDALEICYKITTRLRIT